MAVRRKRGRFVALVLALGLVATALAWVAIRPSLASAGFLIDLSGISTPWRAWLPDQPVPVTTRDVRIPTRHGAIDARVFEPATRDGLTLVVIPGVHAGGVDEPRLVAFAQRLAATRTRVVAIPLPDLRRFRLTPRSTDEIEDATRWVADDATLAPEGRVGLAGVSFSGGLALVAAGRGSLDGKVQAVVSLGGPADVAGVMRYLCTGVLPDGGTRPPHEYGIVIVMLHMIEHLVPHEQVAQLERGVEDYLVASSASAADPARAAKIVETITRDVGAWPEPSRTLMRMVLTHDVAGLGPRLLPYIDLVGTDPALSPARSPATRLPVFLLHGAEDNVIPTSEMPALRDYLVRHGNAHVQGLVTPLLSHATLATGAATGDLFRLVRFWTSARGALR